MGFCLNGGKFLSLVQDGDCQSGYMIRLHHMDVASNWQAMVNMVAHCFPNVHWSAISLYCRIQMLLEFEDPCLFVVEKRLGLGFTIGLGLGFTMLY